MKQDGGQMLKNVLLTISTFFQIEQTKILLSFSFVIKTVNKCT